MTPALGAPRRQRLMLGGERRGRRPGQAGRRNAGERHAADGKKHPPAIHEGDRPNVVVGPTISHALPQCDSSACRFTA
ncbi:MAG TPA: hypothetical protein VMF87_14595 [Streptosporangiaceae bacterium]|nr:hypothetical protein [Streptosporangiaceae bacterium]